MTALVHFLNSSADRLLRFGGPMLWQSSLLIAALLALDLALHRRVRAAVRYALWLVVLLKLLLPPSLALPTSLAWWVRPSAPPPATISPKSFTVSYSVGSSHAPVASLPVQFVPPPPPHLSTNTWILLTWSIVALGLLVWMLKRWRYVAREAKRALSPPVWLNDLLLETRSALKMKRPVALRLTTHPMSPAVCGFLRPTILLPRSLAESLQPAQLRAVLLHELIHLRRGDVWVNCAQALFQIVYWWHPLLWLANARIRRVREEAVDDAVMLALREESEGYAPTLLAVAKLAFTRPLASLGLIGILESRQALRRRIERLLTFRPPKRTGLTLTSVLGIIAFAAVAAPMSQAPQIAAGQATKVETADDALRSITVKVEPATFIRNIKARAKEMLRSSSDDYTEILLDIMRSEGVDCSPPHDIEFNTKTGDITMRNTPDQLALFQAVINGLNGGQRVPPPNNRPQVLIGAKFYKLTSEQFGQLGLDGPNAPQRLGSSAWLLPPDKLDAFKQRLESLDVEPISSPRIMTAHGIAASLFVGDTAKNIRLECLPFVLDRGEPGVEIATVVHTTGWFSRNPTGDWPTIDGHTNCAVSVRVQFLDKGGAILRATNSNSTADNNLVIFLTAQLVAQAGSDSPAPGVGDSPSPTKPTPTQPADHTDRAGLIRTSAGRRAIMDKLESIRLDTVFFDGVPLDEVVRNLADEARKRDPERKGINFLINPAENDGSGATPAIDPNTGQPISPTSSSVDVASPLIRIKPALTNASLAEVLDALVKGADKPVRYAIEDYAVVFSLGKRPESLFVRTFKYKPEVFLPNLRRKMGLPENSMDSETIASFRKYLANVGLELQPPSSIFLKDRGLIVVRAPLRQLETIEKLITELNDGLPQSEIPWPPPPLQPHIIELKLNIIRLNSPAYVRAPLIDVVRILSQETKNLDPDMTGFAYHVKYSSRHGMVDLSDVKITVPALSNVSLADLLTAITEGADRAIAYRIWAGIEFYLPEDPPPLPTGLTNGEVSATRSNGSAPAPSTLAGEPSTNLYTRTFKVDLNVFRESLRRKLGKADADQSTGELLHKVITDAGITLDAPKNLFYAEDGRLIVRGTQADLDSVEKVLAALNTAPQQITITAKFVEMPEKVASNLLKTWFRTNVNGTSTQSAVLAEQRTSKLEKEFEKQDGVDVLATPRVTTLSGRQAQIQVTEIRSIIKGIRPEALKPPGVKTADGTNGTPFQLESVPFGPVLDIVPSVLPDGHLIKLEVTATVNEFLGYADSGRTNDVVIYVNGKSSTIPKPLPKFHARQLTSNVLVQDGQTLLIGKTFPHVEPLKDKVPVLGDIPLLGKLFRSESSTTGRRSLVVLVTPTLVDPAGNPVHSSDNEARPER